MFVRGSAVGSRTEEEEAKQKGRCLRSVAEESQNRAKKCEELQLFLHIFAQFVN